MRVRSFSNVSTQNQQQSRNSNHGPVSKDLLFLNWLLMYLAGNYCYVIGVIPPQGFRSG